MESVKIAVIGGSGLYNMPAISDVATLELETPFGKPSGALRIGTLRGRRVAFLPRHGEGHILSPATLPYRANILALKQLGVRFIIAVNAVGSLREELAPGHIVTPDQIVDYTIQKRARSFFESGVVAHISVAEPMSAYLRAILADASRQSAVLCTVPAPSWWRTGLASPRVPKAISFAPGVAILSE